MPSIVDIQEDTIKDIEKIMYTLTTYKEVVGRCERGRLLAIVITNLETAKLFLKEIK